MSKAIRWTEDQLSAWNAGRKQALEAIKPKPAKKTVKPRTTSKGELLLDAQLRSVGMAFIPQYKPIPARKFAFDYFVAPDLLIEVQGGVYAKGNSGHTSGTGITRDCEKASLAAVMGFRTILVTTAHVNNGKALEWIQAARKHGIQALMLKRHEEHTHD